MRQRSSMSALHLVSRFCLHNTSLIPIIFPNRHQLPQVQRSLTCQSRDLNVLPYHEMESSCSPTNVDLYLPLIYIVIDALHILIQTLHICNEIDGK